MTLVASDIDDTRLASPTRVTIVAVIERPRGPSSNSKKSVVTLATTGAHGGCPA